ncbi:MAG TPA: hypothetical protein VI141_09570, partial [Acidimicrobiia bacterium]
PMPWYWTDDVALVLVAKGRIDASIGDTLRQLPVAYRVDLETIEAAAEQLLDEGEIPLAA